MNFVQIIDLFLFTHQFLCDVEHVLQGEISGIHDGILIIQADKKAPVTKEEKVPVTDFFFLKKKKAPVTKKKKNSP